MTAPALRNLLGMPATSAAVVTPNDSTDLPARARGLYVGGAGDVSVFLWDDTVAVVFAGVPAGTVLPVAVKRMKSTGTTATSIVALL